ncbi:BET1 homolog [Schistocerca americana]|uniref:BET1 homolog n=1 Tax=Schistocerca americana TaxID=7009 RepID=UPI001F50081B|nr:BET1 homolog [Schistocerca americana]XP_046986648.1 BET1 homolog [Schistocerca americana]XP_046986649.1 BET1 homolog [Schistocerca americana]XP_046986650.1 BET1 homolog [Schistocerca americana]XP_047102846.1 BET1 homolog [Schistocerca piceifrons]XP_047102847.1 BET1 homolog [Schistocerca piceifrons]XP_047102848.1 BET1 homolog [Schistocerca piceifrons]XP_049783044.1 BET1 homolog isoform X1 [Schistocerca cancellata]XP_049783045.1 BET1 homolog isoform X1 [Schistocerca cancellata]XP_04978304
MRRAHAGQFYEPVPTNVDHGDILEEENEKMTALLRDKIHDLKAVTLEIGNEVKYQEKLLNHMADDFDRTGGFLKNTMNRVVRLGKGSHNHYILYLFIFSFSVFFTLWLVLKMR